MSAPKPIQFRLPPDEYDILETWANHAGEPVGTYVKGLVSRRIQRALTEQAQQGGTINDHKPPYTHGQWTPNINRPIDER